MTACSAHSGGRGGTAWSFNILENDPLQVVTVWADPRGGSTMRSALIRGLRFQTASGIAKMVGHAIGSKWEMRGEEVTGFFGGSGQLIDRLWLLARRTTTQGPYGGYGGRVFTHNATVGSQIVRVYGRSGALVDGIGFVYEDANGTRRDSGYRGGSGGQPWSFAIPRGDSLVSIRVRAEGWIHQLTLRTHNGLSMTVGAATGTVRRPMEFAGHDIVSIGGSSGRFLDRIFVHLKKRAMPLGGRCLGGLGATLAVDGLPRVGQPLRVHGNRPPANAPGGVYVSAMPQAPTPMPFGCYIWLDLGTLAFAGAIPPGGSLTPWTMSWNIPTHPALVGFELAMQGAFFAGGGIILTNGHHLTPLR